MSELIELIIREPPPVAEGEKEERNRFKNANVACELLTSDVQVITDALTNDEELLLKLYSFIRPDEPLNPLLASFFCKTMSLAFVKNTPKLLEFLRRQEDLVDRVLHHIETSAIVDLLLKLITGAEKDELRTEMAAWFQEKRLIGQLVSIFRKEFSSNAQANTAQLLCDIIRLSREHQSLLQDKAEPDMLLQGLESSDIVTQLLENMFSSGCETSLVNGISILQSLLEYKRHR